MVNQCPTCLGTSLWNNSSTHCHLFVDVVNNSQGTSVVVYSNKTVLKQFNCQPLCRILSMYHIIEALQHEKIHEN